MDVWNCTPGPRAVTMRWGAGGGMLVRARGMEVERVTWGWEKGRRARQVREGSVRGPAFPPPLHSKGEPLLYKGSWALHANKMSLA